jgi:hypothetical protein
MESLDGAPGFELTGALFCEVDEVGHAKEITEAEAIEKYGY